MITEHNATVISSLRRVPDHPNYLLVGCMKSLLVVKADPGSLVLVACMPQLHSNIVVDIVASSRSILTLGKGDTYLRMLTF